MLDIGWLNLSQSESPDKPELSEWDRKLLRPRMITDIAPSRTQFIEAARVDLGLPHLAPSQLKAIL
ncbi:hypothetical protein [Arthrobacter celericrescens]|uniref:hypothetical protein n=1 Tax=Arthrobacter celericrescens TaxID=2320851 RepID=UPI0013C48BB0|nr:hypothetical protein [Arthrobacter celericrescens]